MNLIYILQIAGMLLGGIATLVIAAGAIGWLWSSFRQGAAKQQIDTLGSENQLTAFWKNELEGFKGMVNTLNVKLRDQAQDFNSQIRALSNQLAEVKGQLTESQKTSSQYLAILQNKNPEMESFMKYITEAAKDAEEFRTTSLLLFNKMITVLDTIHTTTLNNNKILHKDPKDFQIAATITQAN